MSLVKRLLGNGLARRCICVVVASYIWLVRRSGRWTVHGGEIPRRFWSAGKPFILCFWHGRLLMMPYCWSPAAPMNMLISSHRDGQLIAGTIRHFGLGSISGSRRRGGAAAFRAILRALRNGESVGITPDGPRGPRMRAGQGVVEAARLSGVPVIPSAVATTCRKVLGSWDRFIVDFPFCRGVFVWGEPIEVPRNAGADERDHARRRIEEALNQVTEQADALVGQPGIAALSADDH